MTVGSVSTTTTYTYDGLSLLSLAATRSDGATWSVSYLYDASGRAYAGVYEASDASATAFQMVTTDRGDVVELLDASGASFAAYRYDEWGLATETTSAATALAQAISSRQPLRYAGYCLDADEGLYYLSARSYDPLTRQFLSKDPAKADGEESAYQYCGGDVAARVDPSGMFTWSTGWHLTQCSSRIERKSRLLLTWTLLANYYVLRSGVAAGFTGLWSVWKVRVRWVHTMWRLHYANSTRPSTQASTRTGAVTFYIVDTNYFLCRRILEVEHYAFYLHRRQDKLHTNLIPEGDPWTHRHRLTWKLSHWPL